MEDWLVHDGYVVHDGLSDNPPSEPHSPPVQSIPYGIDYFPGKPDHLQ